MNRLLIVVGITGTFLGVIEYLLSLVDKWGKLDAVRNLSFYVDGYMRGGFNRTRLRIRCPTTGRHLWFVKLTSAEYGRDYGLTRFFLRLTVDGCSTDEFHRAQEALARAGIEYYLTTERDPSPQALVVHCDMDVDMAVRAARCILVDVFGLSDESPLRYGGYGPVNTSQSAIVGWDDSQQLEEYVRKRAAAGKPIPKRYMHLVGKAER